LAKKIVILGIFAANCAVRTAKIDRYTYYWLKNICTLVYIAQTLMHISVQFELLKFVNTFRYRQFKHDHGTFLLWYTLILELKNNAT
jgi:hypothetical protein